jgi:cold shock CspA family protein
MLSLGAMFLLVLRLLGYGLKLRGNAIPMLIVAGTLLLVATLLRSNVHRFRPKLPFEPMQGKIKWFGPEEDCALIEGEEGIDVFFHGNSFACSDERPLHDGDAVVFKLEQTGASMTNQNLQIKVLRRSG